jgi:hypothetical protein
MKYVSGSFMIETNEMLTTVVGHAPPLAQL